MAFKNRHAYLMMVVDTRLKNNCLLKIAIALAFGPSQFFTRRQKPREGPGIHPQVE